jgi:hypothetical protein
MVLKKLSLIGSDEETMLRKGTDIVIARSEATKQSLGPLAIKILQAMEMIFYLSGDSSSSPIWIAPFRVHGSNQ